MSRHVVLLLTLLLPVASPLRAAEVLCDPAHQDCRTLLLSYIQGERDRIDVAMWFMEDTGMADAIIARFRAGVAVRALVDPRRNTTTPMNATILRMFEDAGIPIRYKSAGGILHWKYMIFNGQNTLQFSAANYADYYFRPAVPYVDYTDEGIYFGDDPAIVDSFRRKFDDSWVDTAAFSNYANVSAPPARAYPLHPVDPSLNFVPWEDFGKRSVPFYDAEQTRIDVIMYKITEPTHADGLIRAVARGVPVRVITEPDLYRNASNVWQAYHVDRLHAAGVQVRDRAHAGFNHQKTTLLYGQGLTIFGSSNWTNDSNRVQYEHNYFTDKTWFFAWFRDNFERKWTNRTGHAETKAFVPLPPDPPAYSAPANASTGVSTSAVSVSWRPGLWAHRADVYFGTSPSPPLLASNVSVSPNTTKSYTLPALAAGTTYYWRIVSRTMAGKTAEGPVWSFTTAGTAEPPPPPPPPPDDTPAGEIVLYAAEATTIAGSWRVEADATAAGGRLIRHPNANGGKIGAPSASPANYFELAFSAEAGRAYRLWIRGRADGNAWSNDSVHVQFSGSVDAGGAPTYRIGTTASTEFNLEACSGCGLSGWGWEDNGWGAGALGPAIYFAATGTQRVRIQTREDGLAIDQIALSPQKYLTASPGATKNDTVILAKSGGSNPPPPPSSTDIVLYASEAIVSGSAWRVVTDATAAGGSRIWNPNAGAAKQDTAAPAPASFIELTFAAEAGRPYRLWIRGKAESNAWSNDSVHVQFSGSVSSSGVAAFRIGTTASTVFNLESCNGCGLSGWGWEDNGWGAGVLGPPIYFASSGTQRIRIQTREDGLSIDQIVLSAERYLTAAPGPAKNDATILPR